MIDLNGLAWEEPAGLGLRRTERDYLDAERRRIVYVAATRARDLLVVPKAGDVPAGKFVCGDLLDGAPPELVHVVERYVDGGEPPAWARRQEGGLAGGTPPADGARVEREVGEWWKGVAAEAARPRFRPASVSGEARAEARDETEEATAAGPRKSREGRFGDLFGTTVHHAIGLVLRGATPADAVERAAQHTGLAEHLDAARADVARAIEALRAEDLARFIGPDLQVEYPVAGPWQDGVLLGGYIDLVGATDGRIDVIELKTDAPPEGAVEGIYPKYVAQVRAYGRLLDATGIARGRRLRCGLLFTADGGIRWVEPR
jgi:ATP-dependent helicase/nuclease subunit A